MLYKTTNYSIENEINMKLQSIACFKIPFIEINSWILPLAAKESHYSGEKNAMTIRF
jgi:hypothetical protein